MTIVKASDVTKTYQTKVGTVDALKNVDFEVEAGEFATIMGPSGSGKSTMLNILGLLDTPTEGNVTIDGRQVEDLAVYERTDERRRLLGFIFQDYHLLPTLTAVENVVLPSLFSDGPDRRDRAEELLRRVGLADRFEHYPRELSGGQRQRVAIARSLINEPSVLLADEPTGNLDRDTGNRVLDEFDRIRTEEDVAIIAVSHDEYVGTAADRVLELVDGEIAAERRGERTETPP
jgi:putative ABC transport system ATP-binding protein